MKKIMILVFCVCLFPLYVMAETELVISRAEHSLVILQDKVVMRTFHVAFGSGGRFGKIKQGDRKTPYGEYKVVAIKSSERFHGFIQLNYPNMNDAIQGYQSGLITQQQYESIMDAHAAGVLPPQHTPLGGAIGLHGIGRETEEKIDIHQHFDWTKGCIALRNEEWEQVKSWIRKGTRVIITP